MIYYCLFFRAFSFKKKSSSSTKKVEVPTKVISSNVLANRNVNVPKNGLVTKSPLTFPTKLERPQKSKINNYFPVSSKGTPDAISHTDNYATSGQNPFAVSAIKVTTASNNSGSQFTNGTQGHSSLDASLGFPMDDWDDFDDFETPVRAKNDSFSSEKPGKGSNPASSLCEEKTQFTEKLNHNASVTIPESSSSFANTNVDKSCIDTVGLEHSVDTAPGSPGPSFNHGLEECGLGDSPVRMTKKHCTRLKSVMSDSEEDNDVELKSFKETAGNKLFVVYLYFVLIFDHESTEFNKKF